MDKSCLNLNYLDMDNYHMWIMEQNLWDILFIVGVFYREIREKDFLQDLNFDLDN